MGIDANILLRGIVPDLGAAMQQGQAIGREFKEAPMRNKLLELQSQRQEQAIQSNELETGQNAALAAYQVIGDATADQITPDVYANIISTAQQRGMPVPDELLNYSPQGANQLVSFAQSGKRIQQAKRGGVASAQAFAPKTIRVETGEFDKDGNPLFELRQTSTVFDPSLPQGSRLTQSSVPLGGELVTSTGETITEKRTAEVGAAGEKTAATETAKVDVKVGTAEIVGGAEQKIASLKETGVLEARDENLLKKTSGARNRNIEKAMKFREALQTGLRGSGVGRQAALFAPIGVWTDQGSFDEIFNSFAEVAARERLKASGETRPTDADVQGMKNAMFGVGRSEQANIQLLNDFIEEQQALENKLNSSGQAGDGKSITTQAQFDALPSGAIYLEDGVQYRKP